MSRLAVLIVTAAVLALAACASGHSFKVSSSAPPSGLSAGCQMGIDTSPGGTGGFQPVTAQNISGNMSAYQVTVINHTSDAVTVSGFAVTFTAFGSTITTDNPTVNTSLIEPGETWDFTIDIFNGIQVSDNTYLNETCTVNSVATATGTVTPNEITEPDGEQNTHAAEVQQAQQQLSDDVGTLQENSASLDSDTSLALAVNQMRSDYQTEENAWQTEQQVPVTADNCYVILGDADSVGGDADSVGGELYSLQYVVSYLQRNGLRAVKNDLAAVNGDLSTLHGLGATPAVSYSGAVTAGNKALSDAANAIAWADGQGSTINNEAKQLAATAQNYASAHSC